MWVNSIPGTAKCCINNMHNSVIESQQLNRLMHNKFKYEITAYAYRYLLVNITDIAEEIALLYLN